MLKGLHNHWTKKGNRLMPKMPFESENEALDYMRIYGVSGNIYNVYKCADCGKWHIGHRMDNIRTR